MSAVGYAEFSRVVHEEGSTRRIPLNGTIEVTHRCPLACSHCYNNLPMGDTTARLGELSLEEHRRIVDEIVEAGCLWLLYTGGEVFARPDFLDIYRYAREQGLLITLFTNGTLITPRIADFLAEWRPFSIEITLYGHTRETYERLTGIPGSFDRCRRGIELLLERNLPLKLKTVALSINRHEVKAMERWARDLGLEFKFDAMINPRIDCSASPLATRLTPAEVVALDLSDAVRAAEYRKLLVEQGAPIKAGPHGDQLYQCGGALHSFSIDPYGNLSVCLLSRQDLYSLREGSFREGWEEFLLRVRQRRRARVTKCTECHLRVMCPGCPATAELETGDPETSIPFFCHVTHLRAQALGIPVTPHGECEFCEGGVHHETLLRSLADLREERPLEEYRKPLTLLPVLGGEGAAAGCGSGGCAACA